MTNWKITMSFQQFVCLQLVHKYILQSTRHLQYTAQAELFIANIRTAVEGTVRIVTKREQNVISRKMIRVLASHWNKCTLLNTRCSESPCTKHHFIRCWIYPHSRPAARNRFSSRLALLVDEIHWMVYCCGRSWNEFKIENIWLVHKMNAIENLSA